MTVIVDGHPYHERLAAVLRSASLEPDLTPVVAWSLEEPHVATARRQLPEVRGWALRAGLPEALAVVLGHSLSDEPVLVEERAPATTGPAETAQALRLECPLPVTCALSVQLTPIPQGAVVVVRVSHLIADAFDACDVMRAVGALLTGESPSLQTYDLRRDEHARFYARPLAALEVVRACAGRAEPSDSIRPGRVGVGRAAALPVRWNARPLSFDALFGVAARALRPYVGVGQTWQYPFTPPTFRGSRGYFVEIKTVSVTVDGAEERIFGEARRRLEAAGRFSEGDDVDGENTARFARRPRLVLTATSAYRTLSPAFADIPTVSARSLDDVRLQWDRSASHLQLQFKTAFLTFHEAHGVVRAIEKELS